MIGRRERIFLSIHSETASRILNSIVAVERKCNDFAARWVEQVVRVAKNEERERRIDDEDISYGLQSSYQIVALR